MNSPQAAPAFVAPMISCSSDLHRLPLPWLHPVRWRNRSGDRQAYFEIEDLTRIPQMMREPRPSDLDFLGSENAA